MGADFCNFSRLGWNTQMLYLTDNETILQVIHRWIDCGTKLNPSKSPDVDVLKKIIIKLQKRVLAGAATFLVKVKAHRGDPVNEEADIRSVPMYVRVCVCVRVCPCMCVCVCVCVCVRASY